MICSIYIDDEVNCRIHGLRPEHSKLLYDKFGIMVEGAFHMPAVQLRRWDGKIRYFNPNGAFYTKLLDEVLPYLATWGYEIETHDKRVQTTVITDRVDENFFNLADWKLRPYQVNTVNALLDEGSGFGVLATGAGKTSICAALAFVLYINGFQTIVIVPSSDLVTQTIDEFREKLEFYDTPIGAYSGTEKNIDCPIVVATWQALQNHPEYMSYFQAVIVDESHGCKAKVIQDLINIHGKHISYRYGCTGTYPKAQTDAYALKLSIGKIVCEVPARWLIDQGYLSEIEIQPMETMDEDPELPDYAAEKTYLTNIDSRSEAIAREIEELRSKYGNTMVLINTQSLAQGRAVADLIPDAVYLDGGSKKQLRQEQYAEYANRDDMIIIASAGIASTGLSIDRIFCLVLLDTGKSFVKCIQSVGRGLRKKGDKSKIYVVDLHSHLKYAKKHFKDRKKYYAEAQYHTNQIKKLRY
jgi:superfamily II DNA or RNA helicase